jgi:hypothetical protein
VALTWLAGFAGVSARAQARPDSVELSLKTHTVELAAGDVSGSWQGTFSLDSTWRLEDRASTRSIPARLHFNPVGDASPTTSSARSVHPGMFEIDFSRFGFTLSTPEALGWSAAADSMRAVLNPTVDHGLVELHGVFRGETIVGTWHYRSDPGGASGRFEVKRVSTR